MNNEPYNVDELSQVIAGIQSKYQDKKMRFFHLKSVKNFIVHFNSIKDKRKKEFVYTKLYNYLSIISDMEDISEMDRTTGKAFYDEYIEPVSGIYVRYARFSPYPGAKVLIFIFLIVFSLLLLIGAAYYVYLIVGFIFIFLFLRSEWKRKKSKVFGLFF